MRSRLLRFWTRLSQYWQHLGTATQLLLILDALALLLIGGLLLFTNRVIVHSIHTSLDNDLDHHLKTIRTIFQREGYYFTAEGRTVLTLAQSTVPFNEDDAQVVTQLLDAIQSSHDMHGSYVLSPTGELLAQVGATLPPVEALVRHPLFTQVSLGKSVSQLIAVNDELWWINATPHTDADGRVYAVLVFARQVDSTYLGSLRDSVGPEIILTDGQNTVTSFATQFPECCAAAKLLDSLRTNSPPARFDIRVNDVSYRVVAEPLDPQLAPGITVALLQPKTTTELIIRHTNSLLLIIGLLLISVTFGLVHFLVYRIFRPIDRLKEAADVMAAGQLDQPIRADGAIEVRTLASTLDQMRRRLQELLNAQRTWNEQLETEVQARTHALRELCQQRDRLLRKLISAQEEERHRIGRELHDETSQTLAHLIIVSEVIARTTSDEKTRHQLYQIKELTTKALEDIRRIILDLRPRLLDEYGLAAAIHHYAQERLSPRGITFNMETRGQERRLPYHAEINLFRIAQEAINNIVRHAHATHVDIHLSWEEDQIFLSIADNGCGFDPEEVMSNARGERGLGLLGMRERASLFGGTLIIQSAPGHGTVITVQVPAVEGEFIYVQNQGITCG